MRFMFDSISKCLQQFVDYLYDHPKYTSSMDAKDAFTRFTNNVIASVFFGVSVNSLEDRNNEFSVKGKDVFANFTCSIVKMLLVHFCLRIFNILGITIIPVATSNPFCKVISKNLKEREERGIVRPDMLHLLIQARDKEKMATYHMDIDDIVSQAFFFFLAGTDSSSNFYVLLFTRVIPKF